MSPISVTRVSFIDNRIIKLADLQKFANVIFDVSRKWRRKSEHKHTYFVVESQDNSKYKSENPSIFATDFPSDSKRVIAVEMGFSVEPQVEIRINLKHGSSSERPQDNQIVVRGEDEIWVDGITRRLEAIEKTIEPQNTFIQKYNLWLYLAFSIGIGALILSLAYLPPINSWIKSVIDPKLFDTLGYYQILKYLFFGIVGLGPAAYFMEKAKSNWPAIEIQVGPEHEFIEKQKRNSILNIIVLGILPLLLQLVYDLLIRPAIIE